MSNFIQIAAAHVGTQAGLARLLGIKQQNLTQWIRHKRPVPVKHCLAIEAFTGGRVTCEELRPDIDWRLYRAPRPRKRT